jgi:hypothetical protein
MRIPSHPSRPLLVAVLVAYYCATCAIVPSSAKSENEEAELPTPAPANNKKFKTSSKSYGGFLFRSINNKKSSYVKCVSDDECRLIRDDLVCKANKCRRDCPGACETVTLCKTDKNCWNLGPRYECARDGICAKRPEEELQEGKNELDGAYFNYSSTR